ncbi:MAG: ribosome small subunit-dependent GTPase A [Bacteroidales bacterium]|nr:ribosome small subunit-dependent GTPase A [Bacteroidales bacterium]
MKGKFNRHTSSRGRGQSAEVSGREGSASGERGFSSGTHSSASGVQGSDSGVQGAASGKGSSASGVAVVVKHTGSHYLLSRLPEWRPFLAVIKGKLRLETTTTTNPIAVGDIVEYEGSAEAAAVVSGTGAANEKHSLDIESKTFGGREAVCSIKKVLPRRNCIVRRSANLSRQNHVIAANIDRVFLVVTLRDPEVKLQFVDRFLVTCEAYGVPVTILLNKADLYRGEEEPALDGNLGASATGDEELADEELAQMAAGFMQIYGNAGYQVMETSVKTGFNIGNLKRMCQGKVVLFSGQSGVGKSSLVNALDPSLNLRTAEISQAHLQGRHTTTFYQMHPLSCGGFVVDTPGIRGFGLVDFNKEELSNYFPEMLRVEDNCRFVPCTHTHEPGCAVKEAVEKGEISPLRYASYLAMLEDDGKYREGDD